MRYTRALRAYPLIPVLALGLWAAPRVDTEQFRNAKVAVAERTLNEGQMDKSGEYPSVTVFFEPASFELTPAGGKAQKVVVKRGDVKYLPAQSRIIKNTGSAPLHFVRVDLLGPGGSETWGTTGLAPHYNLLDENRYARVYDIRIPAHTNEPQHSHKDRVVVCLSGAKLMHRYPDGREEPSTLKTGESAWRRGSTHIGQNQGDTDLWVIAIEPK